MEISPNSTTTREFPLLERRQLVVRRPFSALSIDACARNSYT